MLVGWVLGFGLDLTAAGGPGGGTVLGPMAALYALTAWGVFEVRDAFFRERIHAQALLTLGFCLIVHVGWLTVQSLVAVRYMTWSVYGEMLLQAVGVAIYTALLAPLVHWGLRRGQRVLMVGPVGRGRRAGG
jgi:cell shape-determining protein MreD